MTCPDITVRPTALADIPAGETVLADGKRALAAFGIPQWQGAYPNGNDIAADIEAGASYVAVDAADTVLGILALGMDGDSTYDVIEGSWLTSSTSEDPRYAVIHRCAVSASAARRGVMSAMFEAAEKRACSLGAESMRVDTHERNAPMRSLLEKRGYTLCGSIVLPPEDQTDPARIAYEKPLA